MEQIHIPGEPNFMLWAYTTQFVKFRSQTQWEDSVVHSFKEKVNERFFKQEIRIT